jgi:hypothetical protein
MWDVDAGPSDETVDTEFPRRSAAVGVTRKRTLTSQSRKR